MNDIQVLAVGMITSILFTNLAIFLKSKFWWKQRFDKKLYVFNTAFWIILFIVFLILTMNESEQPPLPPFYNN